MADAWRPWTVERQGPDRRRGRRRADVLIDASHQIHAHPELGFEEHFAHDLLTGILEAEGLDGRARRLRPRHRVRGPGRHRRARPSRCCCEYDALPGIGHACGHNIIATAGLGAGLAAAALADELGGRVVDPRHARPRRAAAARSCMVERGRVRRRRRRDDGAPGRRATCRRMNVIAIQQLWVDLPRARPPTPPPFPHKGRNALDAAVLGYMNVAALRQHIRPDERIHGIFTDGGDKPNIVPGPRRGRTGTCGRRRSSALEPLKARVLACLEAGADAAGCAMELRVAGPGLRRHGRQRADASTSTPTNAARARPHRSPTRATPARVVGSTDMGNVSYVVPSIHPMIKVAPARRRDPHAEFAELRRRRATATGPSSTGPRRWR